jgi:hypothetical protein
MLFNLSKFCNYPAKRKYSENIICSRDKGPCFGGKEGGIELGAHVEPFNGDRKCISFAN